MQPSSSAHRHRERTAIIILLLAAFALRVARLDTFPLRGDESFTMVEWLADLGRTLGPLATVDPQPPGAVLAIFGWTKVVGTGELAARYLSVLASVAAMSAVYSMGRTVAGRQAGLLAALLWALNPYQVWFAQDVRNAALWVAFSTLSMWSMLRAISKPGDWRRWALYTVMTALALYTFYLELFLVAAQTLFLLALTLRQRLKWRTWLPAQAAVLLLIMPWYAQPRLYSGSYHPTAGGVNVPWAFQAFIFGETLPAPLQLAPYRPQQGGIAGWLALALVAGALLLVVRHLKPWKWQFIVIYALLPPLLLAGVEVVLSRGYYRPRYALSAAPGMVLALATGLAVLTRSAERRRWGRVAAGGLLALVALIDLVGLTHYYFDPAFAKAKGWREVTNTLERETLPADVIIRNYPDPTFVYYYDGPADVTLLPVPGEDPAPQLEALVDEHRTVWFLPQPSPYFDAEGAVEAWLRDNLYLVVDRFEGGRIMQFAPYTASPAEIEFVLDATFGDIAVLKGYNTVPDNTIDLAPGQQLDMQLFWQPVGQSDAPLTVFVHLLGPPRPDGSPLWANHDHPPQNQRVSTDTWSGEDLLRDAYTLNIPEELPAGTYHIAVGFYDPETLDRVENIQPAERLIGPGSLRLFSFEVP